MKKRFMVVATAALMTMATFVPAFAQTGSVQIDAGDKSFVGENVTFEAFALDGTDKVDLSGTTGVYTMTDFSGTGAGWELQISASDFEIAGQPLKNIPLTGFEVAVDALTLVDNGDIAPTSDLVTAQNLSLVRTIATAGVGTGRGQYTFTPVFTLDVPATTYVGTYVTTITLHLNAAPS